MYEKSDCIMSTIFLFYFCFIFTLEVTSVVTDSVFVLVTDHYVM